MSFHGVQIIRGVVVDFVGVLNYFASIGKMQEIVDYTNQLLDEKCIHPSGFTGHLSVGGNTVTLLAKWIKTVEGYKDLINENFISIMLQDFVHTWSCCSKLKMKKFVLGDRIQIPLLENLLDCSSSVHSMKNLEINTSTLDEGILKKLEPIGITKEQIETIIIPIGCGCD